MKGFNRSSSSSISRSSNHRGQQQQQQSETLHDCSASSNGSVSDESVDDNGIKDGRNPLELDCPTYAVGTLVKKYFTRLGWVIGRVINIRFNGTYEVLYDSNDNALSQPYVYSQTRVSRLTKTAYIRTGTKLSIYWPDENRYYTAVITKELPRKRENYLICYCNNTAEYEWIDLNRHKFRVVVPSSFPPDSIVQNKFKYPMEPKAVVFNGTEPYQNDNKSVPTKNKRKMASMGKKKSIGNASIVSISNTDPFPLEITPAHDFTRLDSSSSFSKRSVDNNNSPTDHNPNHDEMSPLRVPQTNPPNDVLEGNPMLAQNENDADLVQSIDTCSRMTEDIGSSCKDMLNVQLNLQNENMKRFSNIPNDTSNTETRIIGGADTVSIGSSRGEDIAFISKSSSTETTPIAEKTYEAVVQASTSLSNAVTNDIMTDTVTYAAESELANLKNINNTQFTTEESFTHATVVDDCEQDKSLNESFLSQIDVGSRVEVYWPDDECYYGGIVLKKRTAKSGKLTKKPFFIMYDDEETEWIDFNEHKIRVLEMTGKKTALEEPEGFNIITDGPNDLDDQKPSCTSLQSEPKSALECEVHEGTNSLQFKKGEATQIKNIKADDNEDHIVQHSIAPENDANPISDAAKLNSISDVDNDDQKSIPKVDVIPDSMISFGIDNDFHNEGKRRRTSRNIHPPNFFANEILTSLPSTVASNDHIGRSSAGSLNHKKGTKENKIFVASNTAGLNLSSPCNGVNSISSSDSLGSHSRENRKAVLDALAKKRSFKQIEVGSDEESLNTGCMPESNAGTVRKPTEDSTKFHVGLKVSVLCKKSNTYRIGVIRDETKKNHRNLVEYSDDGSEEWIDFRKAEFKIMKRKRGRPKKSLISNEETLNQPELNNEDVDYDVNDNISELKVGLKVSLLGADGVYYVVTINSERSNSKPFFIEYEGNIKKSHWIDFKMHQYKIVDSIFPTIPTDVPQKSTASELSKIVVGSHIAVWWEGEASYKGGIVTKIRNHNRPFFLVYDDGLAKHWVDLRLHKFKFLEDSKAKKESLPQRKKKKMDSSKNVEVHKIEADQEVCQNVKNKNDHTQKSSGSVLSKICVGSRIEIWWAGDLAYYAAIVKKVGPDGKKFYISYDDDEEEWIDLTENNFRLITPNNKVGKRKLEDSSVEDTESEIIEASDSVYPDIDNDFVYGDVDKVKVGSRIAVWWTMDKVYYAGKVVKISDGRKPFFIKYDDNDEEWTDLRKRYFRILDK